MQPEEHKPEEHVEPPIEQAAGEKPDESSASEDIQQDQPVVSNTHQKPPKRKWYVLAAIIVVVVAAAAAWFFWHSNRTQPKAPPVTEQQQTPPPAKTTNFLQTPKKLANLHLFANYNSFFDQNCANPPSCTQWTPLVNDSNIAYYQIGNLADGNQIIVIQVPSGSPVAVQDMVVEQTGPSTYAILTKQSALTGSTTNQELQKTLASNVHIDDTTTIAALAFPTTLTVDGLSLALDSSNPATAGYFMGGGLTGIRGSYFGKPASGTQPVKVTTVNGKDIYEVTAQDKPNYQAKEWYTTINQVYAAAYHVVDPVNSPTSSDGTQTKPVSITWTNGQQNNSVYSNPFVSCGINQGYLVPKNLTKNQLTQVGTTATNQAVYALPNDSPLLNELYKNDYNTQNKSLQNLSLQQFQDVHAVIISVNSRGELVTHVRSEMFQEGGCGKPVIYLYPSKTTRVNVKVGADVVKSSPLYPTSTGWLNILAQPNGTLTYQSKTYPSLFWEGYGNGRYPAITSGAIVPSNRAVATIRQQLREQGLLPNEINDFLAFWAPRLPHAPYVRLTWFNTGVMQQLAPLNISPRPNTLIRVFLDFEGLQQPINLPAQHLSAPARNGFTVVEWGGLLRDGIR